MLLVYFVLAGLASLLVIWLFFASAMALKNKIEDKSKGVNIAFDLFVGLPFVILDLIFNIIFGTVWYLRLPDFKGARYHLPLFTHRLRSSLGDDPVDSWRFKTSYFVCAYMVEPHDWGHCSLHRLIEKIETMMK